MSENSNKTSYEALKNITVKDLKDDKSFEANKIWENNPALIFVGKPGCQLCREESSKLVSFKNLISDKMGLRMVAIVHENLDNEVEEFNNGFWKGEVYLDEKKAFYTALGGGEIRYGGYMSIFKPSVWMNIGRNWKTGVQGNYKGEGRILGGLYILKPGTAGVHYQHNEKVWGDVAPLDQVLTACLEVSPKKDDKSIQEEVSSIIDKFKKGELVINDKLLSNDPPATCNSIEACT
nr:11876_t:CDS:2 [Entrophospora candida]CAG8528960.1 2024_t:CDS:2 [Entrophospora candida]